MKLLIVDDQNSVHMFLDKMLESHTVGISGVFHAYNGKEALVLLEREKPDIMLLDVKMPVMDGLEACTRIRAMDRGDGPSVPILAMTANAFEEDKQKAFAAGMTGYLVKPLDIRLLVEELKRCLG